ncbi:Histidine kinase-, DNA gyrase B-, and HSP90-like ATPase [Burkholderia sp. YR290]|jgi:signal transduction histidine kinase|uniref:sensor histidine kinase n=1 Tax=Paraburkholderia hospita TaxID=169430 RepID=UPI0009A6AE78|nr:HAMP domain-containing sensor histidine kinase [Paraburkholderia hospita]SKC64700.1 Histidine kinase-, DNA gyrase B-, and HSP90-like ATPase [Paraburkholderia hospita]SOE65002.1 Histidine kinase-, DNA gyrase B-, and HSP90-like ATPase [Burkholderia sp. YR290]
MEPAVSELQPQPANANSEASGNGASDDLFRNAPIPILIEDWSGIHQRLSSLKKAGVVDLDGYFEENPGLIDELRDLHGFVDANNATLALFDAASKEVFFAHACQLLPADRFSNSQVLRAMFDGLASCQGERTLTSLAGRKVPIVWRCALPDDAERYGRLHFYAFDVTEHKENTKRLEALRAEMAHTARVSMAGQLVASITHEIGQPLAAIRTGIDAAFRWLSRSQPNVGEALATLRNATRWADDTSEICRRLRSFLGGAPIEAQSLDCDEVVDSVLTLVSSEANTNNILLHKNVERGATAFADRIHVQQILTNLVINSIHAILATNRAEAGSVEIRAMAFSVTHTVFEVVDSGGGIKTANPDDVFQPFLSTKREGMGMGLALCKSIVESHGGKIWVASTGAAGTSICFTLLRSNYSAANTDRIRYSNPA